MAHVCTIFALILIAAVYDTQSVCVLSLSKDFGTPSPVFIKDGDFLAPNKANGAISLRRSETVLVACPGTKSKIVIANVTSSYNVLEAHCIINTTFRVDRQFVQFKDIRCNTQPHFTSEDKNESCAGDNEVHGVGYNIKNKFYELYTACFDKNLLTTRYVEHALTPTSIYIQSGVTRPSFLEGTLFGKMSMSKLYTSAHQKTRLNAILGDNMADKYLTKKQFLTRGHFAPRADYTTSAEMRATFHYVNCAPQWMRGNAGDWAALEEALRRRIKAKGIDVVVFTGAHGVMTLPDSEGQMQEYYLHTDENNNLQVPVPMYNFKLVYDPSEKTAAAFITINSSFYNSSMIDQLQFCDDICDDNSDYSWLKWRSNDGTYSFCCDYDQFIAEIDYLPELDVQGSFY